MPQVQLTRDDFSKAQLLFRKTTQRWLAITWVGVFVLATLVMNWTDWTQNGIGRSELVYFVVVTLLILLLVWLVLPLLLTWTMVRSAWNKQPDLRRSYDITLTDEGMTFRGVEGEWQRLWSDFYKLKEDDHMMILLIGPRMMQILPKRFYSEDELALARRKVPRR